MHATTSNKELPEYFTTRGPIETTITPISFGNNTYWMATVANYDDESSRHLYNMKPYDDNEEGLLECCDIEDNYDILLTKSGKFMTSFYVPSALLSFIIGPKGIKLKNLQKNTNTLIKVPKLNEKGDVKITGDTERKVASARTQIALIVNQRKDKLPLSHFISIPVNSDEIKEKFNQFHDEILRDPPRGVTPSIFQNPNKLHLTICTLTLVDEEEINAAKNVLRNIYDEIISNVFDKNNTQRIFVEGLEIMNDDPSEVNVLYGKVNMGNQENNSKLQYVADKISEYYYKSGLAKKQYDRVKLHVTLMNTSFRNAEEKRENFDATHILEKFKNFVFGAIDIRTINLSIRFTGGETYYDSASVLNL